MASVFLGEGQSSLAEDRTECWRGGGGGEGKEGGRREFGRAALGNE